MNTNIKFNYGPLSVEIEAEESEEAQEMLTRISSFIEENPELFSSNENFSNHDDNGATEESEAEEQSGSDVSEESINVRDSNWETMVEATGIPAEKLAFMFGVGDEVTPQLLIGDQLDGSDNQQMEEAALMILTVWEDYNGESSMDVSEIKECLRRSGLPHENFTNIYQRSSFNSNFIRQETDSSSILQLTPPGKNQAYQLIQELEEELDID